MRRVCTAFLVPAVMVGLALLVDTGQPSAKLPKKHKVPVGIQKIKHVIVIMQENRVGPKNSSAVPG